MSRIRWVECQLDSISRLRSDADRKDALNHLPDGLPQTYQRMLNTIARVPGDKEIVVKVMAWLTYALRPLRMEELALVAGLQPDKSFHFDQQIDLDEILEICGSFITIKPGKSSNFDVSWEIPGSHIAEYDSVDFAHFSVEEYFTSSTLPDGTTNPYFISEVDGHRLLTLCCLRYLLLTKGPLVPSWKLLHDSNVRFWTM